MASRLHRWSHIGKPLRRLLGLSHSANPQEMVRLVGIKGLIFEGEDRLRLVVGKMFQASFLSFFSESIPWLVRQELQAAREEAARKREEVQHFNQVTGPLLRAPSSSFEIFEFCTCQNCLLLKLPRKASS